MAPGSYSKIFFGISTFQMMYQSNFFFKNHKTELMGVDKIKKYVLTQKISLLAWKIAVLQTFLYHFRTPENPNISKAHIFWLATVMSRTKLILTWFDILLSLEHSGAWPHGAFLISSILRAVIGSTKYWHNNVNKKLKSKVQTFGWFFKHKQIAEFQNVI